MSKGVLPSKFQFCVNCLEDLDGNGVCPDCGPDGKSVLEAVVDAMVNGLPVDPKQEK